MDDGGAAPVGEPRSPLEQQPRLLVRETDRVDRPLVTAISTGRQERIDMREGTVLLSTADPGGGRPAGTRRSAAHARTPPLSRFGAAIGVALGVLVLTGWWLGVPMLKSGIPGYVTMKPNTALGLLLAGAALWLLAPRMRARWSTRLGYACAASCAAIGAVTLLEYQLGVHWPAVDELLVRVTEDAGRTATPGRMAVTSAVGFLQLGLALLLLDRGGRTTRMAASTLVAGALAIPLGVLVGYVYRVIPPHGGGQGLQMAVHTACGFLALGVGLIAARPETGVARLLRSEGPGGMLLRRMLPVALGAPVALGLLRSATEAAGVLDATAGAASATVATIFLLVWVAWRIAIDLDSTSDARFAAEGTLAQRNVALEVANVELDAARGVAEGANRAKTDFLARMSHELRTPLNSVIGFADVLLKNRRGNLTPSDLQFLDRVGANGRHLLALINDVLDIAKVEAGKMEVNLAFVPLETLVHETVAELQGRALQGDLEIDTELPPGLEALHTDPTKLKQILINLLGNALKFTPPGGRVTVRVVADADGRHPVRIDVADTGIGIAASRLGAIFEAFEQADRDTASRFGGTGLGLAISHAFASLLGYRIAVRSTEGIGSVFSVLLAEGAEPPLPPSEDLAVIHRHLAAGDARVLVVDDDPDARRIMSAALLRDLAIVAPPLPGTAPVGP